MATPVAKRMIPQAWLLRDVRPVGQRIRDGLSKTDTAGAILLTIAISTTFFYQAAQFADLFLLIGLLYWRWVTRRPFQLSLKLPAYAPPKMRDPRNLVPGTTRPSKPEGILYLGTDEELGTELWLTNTDARTHILYLGTTGAGKTEGLKSMVANTLTWGSGFVYVDGKADTDLWASLFALARRFGRDDDLLVLNYMTGNSDDGAVSNSMNPFSNGSASYLSNMVVSLMPDAGGDNAMWKERAVALMFALMPALTWKRDKQGLLLDIGVVRDYLELPAIIRLSRDPNLPERIIRGLQGYLATLPGYIDEAFDDEGNERPPSPDQPMYDLQVARQQHGYLSMQFTRSLQSLADEYGYIFKVQLADIDMLDVVLNRRILVVLIPALEKSGDEAANLGKIIAACLKGMMGATLGNTVEGNWESAIGSKQTRSSSSFMTVFDEVGYYTAQGMAVMAAQARSLGFSLVFAAQDLPALEKRVKQEARSILGNCNLKIFGKLEDPVDTKDFLHKHAGDEWVMETKGMTNPTNTLSSLFTDQSFFDDRSAGLNVRQRISYDHCRKLREGQAYMFFAEILVRTRMFYAQPEKVKALRVHKFLPVPATTSSTGARERAMHELAAHLKDPEWTAAASGAEVKSSSEISALAIGFDTARNANLDMIEAGAAAVASLSDLAQQPADNGKNAPAERTNAERTPAQQQRTSGGSNASSSTTQTPPLREGDENAFTDIERQKPEAQKQVQKAPASSGQEMVSTRVIGTSTSDFGVVTRPSDVQVTSEDLALPADMAEVVQKSAEKLNRGLFGKKE